jgi:aryl-alcohol dehydrogenase (NADP+)
VRAGKALYVGASSMYAWQFARMLAVAEQRGFARFVTMQNHYNLMYREEEREMMPLCRAEAIGLIPWSPLARGLLTRTRADIDATVRAKTDPFSQAIYKRDEADLAVIDRVSEVAAGRGVSNAQVALAWVLAQPGVTAPIVGASKAAHLDDAIKALSLKLDDDELKALGEPYRPRAVAGF